MQNPSLGRLVGLDIKVLKRSVIEGWQSGGGKTLIKVFPKGAVPSDDRMVGFCTTLGSVVAHTPLEMERILGFRAYTKLKDGAEIFRVDPLPSADQFELRGYSQLPGGVPQVDGKMVNEQYPPGEGVPQWELTHYPQSGLKWLATVLPGQTFSYDYKNLPISVSVFMGAGER